MNNRKEIQKRKREVRKKRPSNLNRKSKSIKKKPSILIVCEGRNTEPSYINHFKASNINLQVMGTGRNTINIVEIAIEESEKKHYDQIWCVYDKDDFSDERFEDAISLARHKNIKLAYSIQAFEYWILLHFEDHKGGLMSRKKYIPEINKHIQNIFKSKRKNATLVFDNRKHQISTKSKGISREVFNILQSKDHQSKEKRQDIAIRRARKLHQSKQNIDPNKQESISLVYLLVEELVKFSN